MLGRNSGRLVISIFWFVTSSLVFLFTFLWRRFKRGDVNSRCFSERCINWKFNLRFNEDLSVQEVAEDMCKIIKIILCMCSATSFQSCRYFVCCINPLRCTNGKLLQVVTRSWGHFNVESWKLRKARNLKDSLTNWWSYYRTAGTWSGLGHGRKLGSGSISCLGTYVPSDRLDNILRYQSCSGIHFRFIHHVHRCKNFVGVWYRYYDCFRRWFWWHEDSLSRYKRELKQRRRERERERERERLKRQQVS